MGRLRAALSFARLGGARLACERLQHHQPPTADAWTNGLRAAIINDEDPVEARDQMANPNFGTFNRPGTIADQASFDAGLRAHMVRVYNYMASGLALSGIVAFGLFSSAELASLFFEIQAGRVVGLNILGWVAIFAPLGLLMLTSFRAAQMSVGAVQAVYWAVTALMGVSLSLLLFTYTGASVARTFFVTAAAFGALSLYGYTTKRDLTAMGKFLFMGVIGLILAGLVNMIWPSGTMSFIISAAGVLIFSGLIAYDTQKIKEQFAGAWGTDAQEKVAIFSALSLYINFVNLFQFLMMFMGQRR
jgi:FtsH-binding integral membrane protein